MRFIAFAPAQAGLSLFTSPPKKKDTAILTIHPSNTPCACLPRRAFSSYLPSSHFSQLSLPYITPNSSNHFATKRNLPALAPIGLSLFPSPQKKNTTLPFYITLRISNHFANKCDSSHLPLRKQGYFFSTNKPSSFPDKMHSSEQPPIHQTRLACTCPTRAFPP